MAVFALMAIYLDPTEPVRYVALTYALLAGYALYSLAVIVPSSFEVVLPARFAILLHAIDLAFAGAITLFTEGPNSPFFAFFVLNLLTAAFSWGFLGTLVTAAIGVGMLWAQMLVLGSPAAITGGLVEGTYDLNRAIMRTTYLLIIGALAGVLGEYQQQFQREQRILAWLLSRSRVPRTKRGHMNEILERVVHALDAGAVTCVLEASATGQLLKWTARRLPGGLGVKVALSHVDPADREMYLFGPVGYSFYVDSGRWWRPPRRRVLDWHGRRASRDAIIVPHASMMQRAADSMLCVSVPVSDEWLCRVFVSNPAISLDPQRLLEFAHRAAADVATATYNTYLLLQMRLRAEADERARLARELHDGLTQSLIGAEIQLEVLRQQADDQAPAVGSGLTRVRDILRTEILNLRDLVRHTHVSDIKPSNLKDYLTELTDKFQRDTGITTRFLCDLKPAELRVSSRASRELAQIVREALANIRKHSGARQALVSLTAADGLVSLIIDDNGRGFPFAGRHTQAELDRLRRGPLVIKERIRSIGGELTLESTPDLGSRLHITLPV